MAVQLGLIDIDEPKSIVNVSQVKQLSPFRYPGGKTWLVPLFIKWISNLPQHPDILIEPFAGGGIISLSTAFHGLSNKCIMIEKDEEISAVWKTIFSGDYKWLIERILTFELTPESAKTVLDMPIKTTEELAFKTILKNRICHGGIMAAGSGFLKNGENGKGILSRWYPETISRRIETIAAMRNKFEFYEADAFDFITQYISIDNVAFFVDPPYTASVKKAGKRLYRYFDINHDRLFELLSRTKTPFMLTYDFDECVIAKAEKYGFNYTKVPMTGTHHSIKYELIITNR